MAKKRTKRPEPAEPAVVPLELVANTVRGEAYRPTDEWLSQAEALERLGISERTIRNWHAIGLPFRDGPHGRPEYPYPDVWRWAWLYHRRVKSDRLGRGPERQTMACVIWEEMESRADPSPRFPIADTYVMVPLDWDDPYREHFLRIAAAGTRPRTEEEWDAFHAGSEGHPGKLPPGDATAA